MARLGRWLPVLAVLIFIGAAMLAASFGNPTIERLTQNPGELTPAPIRTDVVPQSTPSLGPVVSASAGPTAAPLPAWIGWGFSGLCGAGVIAILGLLLWYSLKERLALRRVTIPPSAAPPSEEEIQRQVQAAIDESLAELDVPGGVDARRAVIACWVRLEAAAAIAGTRRLVGDTSTDLVERLLAAHRVSPERLAEFAAVYRQARYAPHAVDENMRALAVAALRQIRDELAREPALPVASHAGGTGEATDGDGR